MQIGGQAEKEGRARKREEGGRGTSTRTNGKQAGSTGSTGKEGTRRQQQPQHKGKEKTQTQIHRQRRRQMRDEVYGM